MSYTASQIFDAIAPQLAGSINKALFLDLAGGLTSSCYFQTNYNLAIALRAAHMMTLANRLTGDSGQVTGKSEGNASISYAQTQNDNNDLSATSYGVQLQGLINSGVGGVSVTGDDLGEFYC